MAQPKQRTGLNPLSYLGVEPSSPNNFVIHARNPTANDYSNFNLGDEWLNSATDTVYKLVDKDNNVATWSSIGGGSLTLTIATDSGSASPSADTINLLGGTNINTSGTGDTVTINLDSTITGITSLTLDALTINNSLTLGFGTDGVLVADGAGAITASSGTDGQILISSSAGAPAWSTITAGTNISITNAANSITINSTGGSGGVTWNYVTGTTQAMAVGQGYLVNNVAQVVLTLPVTAAQLTVMRVKGMGAGGWKIAQNAGQFIGWDETDNTTTGITGYLESTDDFDAVEIICTTADTVWQILTTKGNVTVV